MAETIDEITIEYEDGGIVTTKQLDKVVLTKGAWSTIMFKYQDWSNKDEAYGRTKYRIGRYQKSKGEYRQKSKFNISNSDQAKKIIDILSKWVGEEAESQIS